MKRAIWLLVFLVAGGSLITAGTAAKKPAVPADVTYSIISDNKSNGIKRSVDVRLNRRASEDMLRDIAQEIRGRDGSRYERTFITFYLPDMKVGSGAWATAHSNPNLEIKILGATEEEFAALQMESSNEPGRQIKGKWFDESPYMSRKLTLYRERNKLFMESTFKDGSSVVQELIEKNSARGRRLDESQRSDFGEFYVINKRGELEMWDSEGIIATAKKID